jgi:hypothetical protein
MINPTFARAYPANIIAVPGAPLKNCSIAMYKYTKPITATNQELIKNPP